MIKQDLLDILRCPMDPRNKIAVVTDHLVCERCPVKFKIKDGFPVLVMEEAELPAGCETLEQLPCQRERRDTSSR